MAVYIGWFGLALGLVSRIFVPWLKARSDDPENAKWSWRYVWPQLIAVVIAGLLLPLVVSDLAGIGEMAFGAAWLIGWAAADIGRFADKLVFKH